MGQPCPGCVRRGLAPAPRSAAWQQDEVHDGLDLPDEDFDYDEFVKREFGRAPHRQLGVKWPWWLLGALLVIVILVLLATNRWGWGW